MRASDLSAADKARIKQHVATYGACQDMDDLAWAELDGDVGVLEILKMDSGARPSGPKSSRTQQGVVAIFEVSDQAALVARAKAAGATLVERWDASDRPASIFYIGDPENNILGFAARHHDPRVRTP